jgi:hypothetical protein
VEGLRLWTLHPKYLDRQGLIALWREGMLAQKVLAGKTKGYMYHPQLHRFKRCENPPAAISAYLKGILLEASCRSYAFDPGKIYPHHFNKNILETEGQLLYEWEHLMDKLRIRSPRVYQNWRTVSCPECHPLFRIMPGEVASWERRKGRQSVPDQCVQNSEKG